MSTEKKVTNAFDAESAVRRSLESQHANVIKSLSFYKSWYSSSGARDFWEVEGYLELKKGKTKKRSFSYQVDPNSGEIFGYHETPIR
jgi:hypothetical protein